MNNSSTEQQLRYLKEVCFSIHRAGFRTKPLEDCQLLVQWNDMPLCRISGKGSVLYRQENVDSIWAQDALQSVIDTAKMTSEYMAILETAPFLKASGLHGDYRVLTDFGDAVLAGHPTERGVQFVTWEWDFDREGVHHGHYFRTTMKPPSGTSPCAAGLFKKAPFLSRSSLQRSTTHYRSSVNRTKPFRVDGIRSWRSSWSRSADYCRKLLCGSGMRRSRAA